MRGKGWLFGYGFLAVVQVLSLFAGWENLKFISKPLLMPVLLAYFLSAATRLPVYRHWISAALFFSWLGDIFLMQEGEQYFITGLASFLLAHLCYILFFFTFQRQQSARRPWNPYILLALGLYAGIFYFFLLPHLSATLKIPVFVYAFVIASMFSFVWHAVSKPLSKPAYWCTFGAVLFILSDSLLAMNSFISPHKNAEISVMITYMLAQAAIIWGAENLLKSKLISPKNETEKLSV